MFNLGIDRHKNYSQVAVLDEKGKFVMNVRLANKKETFTTFINQLGKPCQAVIESGYSWGIIYDLLEELGVDVTLAHSLKVKAIASAKIKTDTIDAHTLAKLLYANLIPTVYVPTKDVRQQKDILRQRSWLVKLRTMVKNRIHQIIERNHVQLPGFSDLFGRGGRKFLDSLTLPQPDESLLRQHLQLLDFTSEQIKQTETWIEETLKDNRYRKIIETIPGFGKTLSALVALEINEIARFSYPGKLAAYAGLVPTTYASGGKVYHGDLLPGCNRWLRYAFIEASWKAMVTSPYCRALFERMRKNKGPHTAVVVLARRLAEIVYCCLKENRGYEERCYPIDKIYFRLPSGRVNH